LGGKPASGLTYLYERVKGKGAGHEKWVVKYFSVHSSADLNSLRHHISRLFSVENAALHRPCAYFLEPGARPAHLALCFPYLNSVNLAHEPLLDLAQIHDVMSASLDALAALHQQGLTHGHLCADNIFRGTGGRLAITDSGLNTVRSLIAAEMTGPAPSPGNDLMALGDLCLNLLGETTAPQRSRRGQQLDQKRAWPGGPLHDLACRLRQDPPLTASQAWQQMQEVPRPQVNRLVTVPQWKSPRKGPDWPG
jgi:serine/threonine protein kinase